MQAGSDVSQRERAAAGEIDKVLDYLSCKAATEVARDNTGVS